MIVRDVAAQSSDPFFEVIHDVDWNACVGSQGDEQNYVDGYIEAAVELVSGVIDKGMMGSRDTLAMPILYNARHAVEIALKFAIDRLHKMGAVAELHRRNHDIVSHLNHIEAASIGDERIRQLIEQLKPFVISLAKVDQDGQELRYAKNAVGTRSLAEFAIVNLPHIRLSLELLRGVLTNLKYRVLDYSRERSVRTFTKECSRTDLKAIAAIMGPHPTWSEASFFARKAAVQARFNLSSRKFSAAINAIRKSRELAALLEIETPLSHLTDDRAIFAIKEWAKRNPVRLDVVKDFGLELFDRDWNAMDRRRRESRELDHAISVGLTLEQQCDLEVLFYLGREREYGDDRPPRGGPGSMLVEQRLLC